MALELLKKHTNTNYTHLHDSNSPSTANNTGL